MLVTKRVRVVIGEPNNGALTFQVPCGIGITALHVRAAIEIDPVLNLVNEAGEIIIFQILHGGSVERHGIVWLRVRRATKGRQKKKTHKSCCPNVFFQGFGFPACVSKIRFGPKMPNKTASISVRVKNWGDKVNRKNRAEEDGGLVSFQKAIF